MKLHSPILRPYSDDDFFSATRLWREAREQAFPDFQREKGHTYDEDCAYFENVILEKNEVWVMELDGRVVAFIAMENDFVDQLYVDPQFQRLGIGTMLLDFAKAGSPKHVWLYTLQINANGCAFYEKNGFVAEKFGVSPAPESEPDVEYHWRGEDKR